MKLTGRKFKNARLSMEIYVYEFEGKELFIGKSVAELLGYHNPSTAVSENISPTQKIKKYVKTIENIENSEIPNSEIINYNNNIVLISEIGLYQLVMKSRKTEAEEFQQWVFSEVLPSLRKNNYYIDKDNITDKQKDELILNLSRMVENGSNILLNNRKRKLVLKNCLEDMFPEIENVYEQFVNQMKKSGILDENNNPTERFLELNKKYSLFVHTIETHTEQKSTLHLTNKGIDHLVKTLYIEDRILKRKKIIEK